MGWIESCERATSQEQMKRLGKLARAYVNVGAGAVMFPN